MNYPTFAEMRTAQRDHLRALRADKKNDLVFGADNFLEVIDTHIDADDACSPEDLFGALEVCDCTPQMSPFPDYGVCHGEAPEEIWAFGSIAPSILEKIEGVAAALEDIKNASTAIEEVRA